jgi:four helix bundle protein
MDTENKTIKSFTDLNAWKFGHKLVLSVYKVTRSFPKEELFALTSQIRRAAVSVTSNIAEGFSRQSFKEKAQFYAMSLGSVTEIQNQLLIAKDIGYISDSEFRAIAEISVDTNKIINGLIKSTKSLNRNHDS